MSRDSEMFSVARIPVDSSEPVRRKFGSRLIGIVTVCLLPLLVFDVPQWFSFCRRSSGAGVYWPVTGRDKSLNR